MKNKQLRSDDIFSAIDRITEQTVYIIGDTALLIAHIFYLILFAAIGVKEMAVYNVLSVAFYSLVMYFVFKRKNRTKIIVAVLCEIMLHACLGTYFLGWGNGLGMFMLFIMPLPFYVPLKKIYMPYLLSAVPFALFMILRINFSKPYMSVYDIHKPSLNTALYVINITFGAIILIYVSSIYMLHREITQRRLTKQNEELQKLASIDPLTQLFNRRAMTEHLKFVKSSSEKSGSSYVIGLGDIDDFKRINDTYGHEAGDEALKFVSSVIAKAVPSEGYASRWGGEEFLIAIPECGETDGVKTAEKIRSLVSGHVFDFNGQNFGVTITIGICEGSPESNFEKIISEADSRLYTGKEQGKNRVVCKENLRTI